jgi:glycosyltransferase involved in cell wall biosynthesis
VLEKNSGTGIARNTALTKSSGRYITLDADDLWEPQKLQKQINFLMLINYRLFSFYDCIDEYGKLLHKE